MNVLFARQAVFDRNLDVVGYALLLQTSSENLELVDVENEMLFYELLQSLSDLGLDKVINKRLVFLQAKSVRHLELISDRFSPERVVIEVNAKTLAQPDMMNLLKELQKERFRMALELMQFEHLSDDLRNLGQFSGLIDMVRVDARVLTPDRLTAAVESIRAQRLRVLMEQVETYEQLQACLQLGADFVQGSFLSTPNMIQTKQLPVNRLVVLRLLNKLYHPDVTSDEIEDIVSKDPILSYKLLRMINSAAFGLVHPVKSIKDAVMYLGLHRIRSWASMISLVQMDDKPNELIQLSLQRAKMCELISKSVSGSDPTSYFMLGLFSILDALLDKSLLDVVSELELDQELKEGLLERKGVMGAVIQNVVAFENGRFPAIAMEFVSKEVFGEAYLSAIEWAKVASDNLYA